MRSNAPIPPYPTSSCKTPDIKSISKMRSNAPIPGPPKNSIKQKMRINAPIPSTQMIIKLDL